MAIIRTYQNTQHTTLNFGKFIEACFSDRSLELKALTQANWEDKIVSTTNVVITLFNK